MSNLYISDISSSLIRPNVQGTAADIVFRQTHFLDWLRRNGLVVQGTGSSPYKWNLISAANTSAEVFVEGQAAPVAGKQTYQQASLNAFYTRVVVGYSGHVRDNVAKGGVWEDPIQLELTKGVADLFKKLDDTLTGSVQDEGLSSINDASSTFAGIAPASVTNWAGKSTNLGGALTIASVENLYRDLLQSPYGASPTDILFHPKQMTVWIQTLGPGQATPSSALMRFRPPMVSGQGFDPGMLAGGLSWNGLPMTYVAGMSNAELHMLDVGSGIQLNVHRDIMVEQLAKTSDDANLQISFACALKFLQRNKHGKLTGLT